jgi:hypothetical protein
MILKQGTQLGIGGLVGLTVKLPAELSWVSSLSKLEHPVIVRSVSWVPVWSKLWPSVRFKLRTNFVEGLNLYFPWGTVYQVSETILSTELTRLQTLNKKHQWCLETDQTKCMVSSAGKVFVSNKSVGSRSGKLRSVVSEKQWYISVKLNLSSFVLGELKRFKHDSEQIRIKKKQGLVAAN